MADQPTLHTSRLALRPFSLADVDDVARLVGDRDVASPTLSIPHPYGPEMAAAWISAHAEAYDRRDGATFAITLRQSGELVGAIGLAVRQEHLRGELGYWIGKPYWGKGYCTEAVGAVMALGFGIFRLARIHACHFARNPASGRVLQKCGMTHEGRLRQHVQRWGVPEDLECYGILRAEFEQLAQQPGGEASAA